jgi:hypothetical protein
MARAGSIVSARTCSHERITNMVMVECPCCLGPIALAEDEEVLSCEDCSLRVEIAPDEPGRREDVRRAA